MKISYFTSTYPRATDTFIQREVKYLRTNDIDVLTCALHVPSNANNVSSEIQAERSNTTYLLPFNPIKLILINIKFLSKSPLNFFKTLYLAFNTRRFGVKGFFYQFFYFQEALLLSDYLNKNKVQHVHNHFGDSSGMVTMLASRLSKVEYSITFHGPHIFFEPYQLALREKVKNSKFIVCISSFCKSQLMLFADKEDWNKFKIVHCGIDVDNYKPSNSSFDQNSSRPLKLLYVGRLAPEKGVSVLFDSLVSLKNDGYSFHLTLLGDGPERIFLESKVKENHLDDMVYFGGYAGQEKVRESLMQTDVFVLPSFAEGVPVSLMEAMACGVAVIATNVGGVAELIEDGVSGLVVPPADEVALKNAISSYIQNPELRDRLSRHGRKIVEVNFNKEIEYKKLKSLILDC